MQTTKIKPTPDNHHHIGRINDGTTPRGRHPERRSTIDYRDSLNPAAIGRQIADLQAALLRLAKDKTEQLYLASMPAALPDVRSGIRTKNKTAS